MLSTIILVALALTALLVGRSVFSMSRATRRPPIAGTPVDENVYFERYLPKRTPGRSRTPL